MQFTMQPIGYVSATRPHAEDDFGAAKKPTFSS